MTKLLNFMRVIHLNWLAKLLNFMRVIHLNWLRGSAALAFNSIVNYCCTQKRPKKAETEKKNRLFCHVFINVGISMGEG